MTAKEPFVIFSSIIIGIWVTVVKWKAGSGREYKHREKTLGVRDPGKSTGGI